MSSSTVDDGHMADVRGRMPASDRPHDVAPVLPHASLAEILLHYGLLRSSDRMKLERRLAKEEVFRSIDDVAGLVEVRMFDAFRAHVGMTIRHASPLVGQACRAEGLDLDALLLAARHDCRWRAWLGGSNPRHVLGVRTRDGNPFAPPSATEVLAQFHRCGAIVRDDCHPSGALGFRFGSHCLEFAMTSRSFRLASFNGRLQLTMRQELPLSLVPAMRGRWVDDVIDCALLNGRGLRIDRVLGDGGAGTRLLMRQAPVPCRMPWVLRGAP